MVLIKPDAVERGRIGNIINRFERVGLKIAACKMVSVDRSTAEKHYPIDRREFIEGMGKKTLENYQAVGVDPKEELGSDDAYEIGKMIQSWLIDYIVSGPVIALVVSGHHAIDIVKKIAGHTLGIMAAPGTIRGDYSFDSSYLANSTKRAIENLVHISGNKKEADYEIGLWFSEEEIYDK